MMSENHGKHEHGHGKHNFSKYSQYVKLYSPKKVDIPNPKEKKLKSEPEQNTKPDYKHAHRDWAVTSIIALSIMISVLAILYIGLQDTTIENSDKNMIWTISAIGLITFFGMLIVSSHHSIMKEDSKGTMRKALASSFLVVYLIVFALIIFSGINISELVNNNSSEDNSQLTPNQILDHLTKIIMVILGFYFGTKGVKEIAEVVKKEPKEKNETHKH